MRSIRGTGDQITGTTLASQLASSTYKNLQVAGVGGEVTDMNLSGVAPGTYTMTYNRTGALVANSTTLLTAGLGQSISATGAAGNTGAVALNAVTGSGVNGTATLAFNASGIVTGITVGTAGTGYKAGDLLSASYSTALTGTSPTNTNTGTITLAAANAGDVLTIHGITFTAAQNLTATQVADALVALAAGGGASNTSGTASGTRTTGVAFTSASSGVLTITNTTGNNLNIAASHQKIVSNIVVGQDVNFTGGSSTLTMSGTVNGIATTQSLAVSANAALATQKFNFDSFGVAFDVKSYQAQTADQIGASIATLNMGVGQSVAGGPGQVIVASGNNSALKFQSGANSDAYIQIDTVNIQTGNTGQYAGSQLEMTTLGRVITQSGAGNLGTLGLTDTIDTWQTAFKNSAAAVDNALEYISTQRAVYGSQANRLSYINTNLQAQSTNLQNSRSSIIDTDFAAETARLTKGQIMQQAATAMLAQANQMPNVILSLLK
jgi:flagellin